MDVRNIVCQIYYIPLHVQYHSKITGYDDGYMLNEHQKSTYSRKKDDNTCLLNEGLSLLKTM